LTSLLPGGRLGLVTRFRVAASLLAALFALTAVGGSGQGLRPGDRFNGMTLAKGTVATAHQKLFDICDPVILSSGRYVRRCGQVPHVLRLFIGYGTFDLPRRINKTWSAAKWMAWLDGRPIDLRRFGTSDRTLVAFPPAGFKDVTLREWRVMLVNPSPGRHTLRYLVREPGGVSDATWTFTVTRR
jgi:hypothetical protein